MENNIKIEEDYKFKISYIFNFFKDMVSSSSNIEDKELNEKIKEIEKQENHSYIADLEKTIGTHEITSKKKSTNKKAEKINETEKAKTEVLKTNNKETKVDEKVLDEEKTR